MPPSSSELANRLLSLRQILKQYPHIAAYTLRTSDAHNSEYLAERDKRIAFISGFTGSNGAIIVTEKEALLWTDGRYFAQAEKELDASLWRLMKMGVPGFPTREEWLAQNLKSNEKVAFDTDLITITEYNGLVKHLTDNGAEGVNAVPLNDDPICKVWGKDRPELPSVDVAKIFELDVNLYAGEKVTDKLKRVREALKLADSTSALVLNGLDEIAWLLNLRGSDIPYNPFFMSFVILTGSDATVFLDKTKMSDVERFTRLTTVEVLDYDQFRGHFLRYAEGAHVIYVPFTASHAIFDIASKASRCKLIQSPVTKFKAVKNSTEQSGMKRAHVIDAVAMCEFLWRLTKSKPGTFDELSAEKYLEGLRAKQETFVSLSFRTISGYGGNGAIIHYASSEKTNTKIMDDNLYLVDSGGQYHYGTTDITRTIHLGEPTKHQKHCFTVVLKGHLNLAATKFPSTVTGHRLDTLARAPMWRYGLDYQHGTGHGVGSFLGVHEGPFSISYNPLMVSEVMKAGYCLSDEPGYYEGGNFGIRIENLLLCVEAPGHNKAGSGMPEYLGFEFLTLVPIQKKLIVKEMLSDEEKDSLNNYHSMVRKIVGEELKKQGKLEVLAWLEKETEPL